MSLPRRMKKRRLEDAERERVLRIPKNDPLVERYGGPYSPDDIAALEYEKIGRAWREIRRQRQWKKDNPS